MNRYFGNKIELNYSIGKQIEFKLGLIEKQIFQLSNVFKRNLKNSETTEFRLIFLSQRPGKSVYWFLVQKWNCLAEQCADGNLHRSSQ